MPGGYFNTVHPQNLSLDIWESFRNKMGCFCSEKGIENGITIWQDSH